MTDKQPEALRLADDLEEPLHDFPEPTTLEAEAASELLRLHAENETLRSGYEAARLEIESLRKEHADELTAAYMCGASREKELAAPQPGAAYAVQDSEHQRAIMEGERNASLDAYSRVVSITSAESRLYERAFTSGWDRRDRLASYGQAPAGESLRTDALCDLSYSHGLKAGWNYCANDDLAGFERAQKIGTEALRTLKSTTAQAAPAAVAGPSDDAVMDRTRDLASSGRWPSDWVDAYRRGYADAAPTTQPALQQVPTLHDLKAVLDVFNTARAGSDKQSGYLRGIRAVLIHWEGRSSATSVQEDAARWHWIAEYLVGPRTDLDDEIVASETINDLRKLVDAARAAQEGKSHE